VIVEHAGGGVGLPPSHTGSSFFHELLVRAVERYSELAAAALPRDARAFKARYATLLPRFEALRVASPRRAEIARYLCQESEHELTFSDEHGTRSLSEALAEPADPLPLLRVDLPGNGELLPSVSFGGRLHQGARLTGLIRELEEKRAMTPAARDALLWLNERAQLGGGLSLRKQRFVLLGAAAELAPVDLLLEAGAEVLWIDLREPGVDRLLATRLAGSIHYVRGGADLLTAPQAVLATMARFAERGPLHIGMYAYAAGESQEWRLTATMNALLRRLPRELVASASVLISPTTPASVSPQDFALASQRKAEAPGWMRSLALSRQLKDGFELGAQEPVARAIVEAQGVSYQAAQYLGKMLAAEACAIYGNDLQDAGAPLTVSANVAPITATRSLSHPVFEAAFLGAPLFHISVAKPEATRVLGGMLTLHDLLNPAAPGASQRSHDSTALRAKSVLSQQLHGGVYAQPFALDGCIRVAAVRGLTKKPGLALDLFR
jgi:hypothetical protein